MCPISEQPLGASVRDEMVATGSAVERSEHAGHTLHRNIYDFLERITFCS